VSQLAAALTFPTTSAPPLAAAVEWPGSGFTLRGAQSADLPFLRDLYASLRADELAALGWPEHAKQAFLDSQFSLQHHHYVSHFAPSDFLLIEQAATPLGRFYLHRHAADFLLLDIALLPRWQNRGIGSSLIRHAQREAHRAGASLSLHVERRNLAARRLYQRLDFAAVGSEGLHLRMRWSASPS
jgi:ribosomal protein S18 acetylase RimI-like enzyme